MKHILLNILKGKGNHAMKFGQLIEYSMRTIFLGKSSTNDVMEKLVPEPILKYKIEHISGSML